MNKYTLLWVYGDKDDTPHVIENAPHNLKALLAEWNALDRQYTDGQPVDWLPVDTWLMSKGVKIAVADEIHLADCD